MLLLVAAAVGLEQQPPQIALSEQKLTGSETFLIELSPGETRWVTEDEKWELRRVI